jgi:3-phenylpropionate/trans-cinnamate dioxygenase ferredoxin reductase subunit
MENEDVPVAAVREVGPDAVAIEFETPADFAAAPGQFVKLTLDVDGEPESRFYTLSSPDVEGTFEVTVAIDPEGEVGPHLRDLSAGDTVRVSGPFGNAYYEGERRVVVLAGGPGVGPAVGIAERGLADGNEAAVVYYDDAPIHEDRLDALTDDGAFVEVLDTGDEDAFTDAVADAIGAGGQVFVYGFADFLSLATDAISAAGGEPDRAKVENFG